MSKTITYTATSPSSLANTNTNSTLMHWFEGPLDQNYIVRPIQGNSPGIVFLGKKNGRQFTATIVVEAATLTLIKTAISDWLELQGTQGTVAVVLNDYSPSTYSNMLLTDIDYPETLTQGHPNLYAILTLQFLQSI